jgi:molybdopterin molybdotransferase
MSELLPVAEAQARLLASVTPVSIETLPITQAIGRWAAAPLVAQRTQPARDLSAMDGYALRFADLPGPWRVIGESAAGRPFQGKVAPGEAVRIFTGAALPDGADTVMVQEEAARDGDQLLLDGEGPLKLGGNVRRRGLDFAQGDTLVVAGERLVPARLAVAATGGVGDVAVHRRVRVAIAATGDELVDPGTAAGPDALPESNRLLIRALLADLPVDIIDLGILPDRLDVLTDAFASVDADLLVTTGGASVGDHDLVRPALIAAGASIDFWRVALRPGKPLMAGQSGLRLRHRATVREAADRAPRRRRAAAAAHHPRHAWRSTAAERPAHRLHARRAGRWRSLRRRYPGQFDAAHAGPCRLPDRPPTARSGAGTRRLGRNPDDRLTP